MPMVFQDDLLSIETGVDMHDPAEGLEISAEHNARDLSNSIKIKVNSSKAHFIQFVTRIVPDIYAFRQEGKIQWDSELASCGENHYMVLPDVPRWKVDTADDSCFYDSAGVHKRTTDYTIIYDCPGGAQPMEERAIFCTFINLGDSITHKIQWSKQYDLNENEFYIVKVQKCAFLPDWAIKTITQDAWGTNSYKNKIFSLPEPLLQNYNPYLSEEDLLRQAKEDFLEAPANWITKIKMPSLFSDYVEQKADSYEIYRPPSP